MSQSPAMTETGYFDTMANAAFKTGADGRQQFYPWGVFGRGYFVSASDADMLRRQLRTYTVVILPLIFISIAFKLFQSLMPLMVFIPVLTFLIGILTGTVVIYLAFVRTALRGCERSTERLSFSDSLTAQARTHRNATLWTMLAAMVGFIALGAAVWMIEPARRDIALGLVIGGAIGGTLTVRMMMIRRRVAA